MAAGNRIGLWLAVCVLGLAAAACGQNHASDLPTGQLLSEAGPTFRVSDGELQTPVKLIVYGDQRFTDPANVTATDPRVRKWLVEKLAEEKPAALLLNGDVPLAGDDPNDYAVYQRETEAWRNAHIRVFPALGNHEFHGRDAQQCLENWWNAFPEMRNRRWYSAQLGARIYTIALDSDASLLPDSDEGRWLTKQIEGVPATVDFIFLSLHHPPVADIQKHIEVDHNPRPNEIALRDELTKLAPQTHARLIVSAGHIHNYERHVVGDVVYLVSGGGGAKPYYVERTPDDLYQSNLFPNYHYVQFVLEGERLRATMYRVADPEAGALSLEARDRFDVMKKAQSAQTAAVLK